MSGAKFTPFVWGQRVRAESGWVGRYEGILCYERPELLRVCWESEDGTRSGVCYLEPHQLTAVPEHPVCLARRLRVTGLRAPRRIASTTPACYLKDYGKTMADLACDVFSDFLCDEIGAAEAVAFLQLCGNAPATEDSEEILSRLTGAMLHFSAEERFPRKVRRLTREAVVSRCDREQANERRWLRTRKALRSIARRAA